MSIKYYLVSILFFTIVNMTFSPGAHAQEFQITGSAYLSDQSSNKDKIMDNAHNGLSIGLGYQQYFSNKWSIGIGASYLKGKFHYQRRNPKGSYSWIFRSILTPLVRNKN